MTEPQYVGQKRLNHALHCWQKRKDGTFKCVLCGGVAKVVTVNDVCDRYELLTTEEQALCGE